MENFVNDFVVNSKGNCFICLNTISYQLTSVKHEGTKLHTLQSMSQYLKMDMTRVFSQKDSIPPSLLAKVKQSRLKVELCEECASLMKSFSVLFHKWEKLEMEMKCKLSHIQEKMATGNATKRQVKSEGSEGINEVLEVLRMEAIEKCTGKIDNQAPRVKIQKLTRKETKAHLRRRNPNDKRAQEPAICTENIWSQSNTVVQINNQSEDSIWNDEDNGNDSFHDIDTNNDVYDEDDDVMPQSVIMTSAAKSATDIEAIDHDPGSGNVKQEHLNELNITAAPSSERSKERNYSFNSGTGKYSCGRCPKEFGSLMGCHTHYDTVHLKLRFKCNLCEKTFSQKGNYSTHLRSAHLGVRFKCLVCNKQFTYKAGLNQHRRKNTCNKGK